MTTTNKYQIEAVTLSGVMNTVSAGGTVDLAPALPKSFTVVDGFVSTSAAGTTNNELSVGDAADDNRYIDDVSFASAAIAGSPFLGTGKGFKSDAGANATVVAKNTGSAATPASDITVTVVVLGYFDHT